MISVFQPSGILPERAKVIPMRDDTQLTSPFLFPSPLVSQQVLAANFNVVFEDFGTKNQPTWIVSFEWA